ncbi:amidohydrolase [Leucobacter sp. cx-42]|uniref:amidohydrolase n=1 Tax=unclassified Leucobacter TaxID=2621730 RepID=UPI00165E669F|nr:MULTISPECIES: amidohydrolase [unclassified Leucobacter]MBC9955106.1 amidohydrolase [Leucobacter sp. cx-42]
MPNTTLYRNATVFTGLADRPLAEAFAVSAGRIVAAGTLEAVRSSFGPGAVPAEITEVDLGGKFVMPGMIEGHSHLRMLGEALDKVQLRDCETLADIQNALAERRAEQPDAPHVLGVSWQFGPLGGERPTAAMIDAVVADVPVLLDANDLHSAWVNTAALKAMGIDRDTPNPVGGEIVRDEHGDATGFLLETAAMQYAWGYLARVTSEEDEDRYLDNAFSVYLETGITGATDMAFDEGLIRPLVRRLRRDGKLPFPVTAHWLLRASGDPAEDLAQVATAARLRDEIHAEFGDDWLRINGVKFVLDGVIDACTAAMRAPYANGENAAPIWSYEAALPVALAVDAAGLQFALHAIGDAASEMAADLVAECIRVNGPRADRRPRIEHLESVGTDTIARMAALGITASMQPVHCDPAIMDNWIEMLGDERGEQGFPWHIFREHGVTLALGTDAPTAPHHALDNLFIALTTRSALDASLPGYHPERAFTPGDALQGLTHGPAYAASQDTDHGTIAAGKRANIAVLSVNPFTDDPETLRTAQVLLTLVDGEVAYRA